MGGMWGGEKGIKREKNEVAVVEKKKGKKKKGGGK